MQLLNRLWVLTSGDNVLQNTWTVTRVELPRAKQPNTVEYATVFVEDGITGLRSGGISETMI